MEQAGRKILARDSLSSTRLSDCQIADREDMKHFTSLASQSLQAGPHTMQARVRLVQRLPCTGSAVPGQHHCGAGTLCGGSRGMAFHDGMNGIFGS